MTAKTYDPACYDLAARFLSDWPEKNTEENRAKLAAHIQYEIESEIEFILKPLTGMATTLCQKCGCSTKGEEAWVNDQIWCHPCADEAPSNSSGAE